MGKMILLVVMGSFIIMGRYMMSNNDVANDAIANVVDYYETANAKHIAASGANLAMGKLKNDLHWRTGFSNETFSEGKLYVDLIDDNTLGIGGLRIVSVGKVDNIKDTVIVNLKLEFYNKYLMFVNVNPMNGYYVTGDTMDGPFHTNSTLNISGSPVFKGHVTMGKGPMKLSDWYAPFDPLFIGGYEYGVKIDYPNSLDNLGVAAKNGGWYKKTNDIWMTFNNDNTVTYKTSPTGTETTSDIKSLAPNGVIAIEGNIHVQGKISGSVTLTALMKSGGGDIYLDDDVGTVDDPRTDPNSNQYLGLCSEKRIVVTDNAANKHDINISAAMFSLERFEVENYGTVGYCGHINLFGSLAQDADGITGVGNKSSITSGFNLNYKFDPRYFTTAPPEFPTTDRFQLLSWWE